MHQTGSAGFALVVALALTLAAACTTQSHAPTTTAGTRELHIKAGDEIRVVTTRHDRVSFEVTEVRDDRFLGVTVKPHAKERRPAGEIVEVPYDELAMLEVKRFDKRSLALAAALVTVSAFAVVSAPVTVLPLPAGP